MPYQPTNPFPYNIAIDLQEGLQFRFKVDNYDIIESFQIDLYDLLKKEKIYTIIRTIGDIQTTEEMGIETKTLIEGDKQIIQIFDNNEEQILLEEYVQGDSILPLKGGFGEYSVGEVNLTNYIVALEDIKKQQNYGDTPNFQSLIITSEDCFVIDERGTITQYIEEKNLGDKNNIVIPYMVNEIEVKNIGNSIFKDNTNLITVVIPACVISLGSESFSGCTNLTEVYLNYGNSGIGSHCFEGNVSLSTINLLDSITSIEDHAFYGCENLVELRLPWGLKTINAYSFSSTGIKSLQLSKETVSIEEEAFSNCIALFEVNCNEHLQIIGKGAFANCINLSNIVFNKKIQTIETEAFLNNNFTRFVIPDSVEGIGVGFLQGNPIEKLITPFIGKDNKNDNKTKTSVLGHFFGESTETGIMQQYAENSYKSYLIPDSLKVVEITQSTFIPYGAFYNCETIRQVQMNQEITRIEDYAFYNCKSFEEIKLPLNITYIGDYAFALADSQ